VGLAQINPSSSASGRAAGNGTTQSFLRRHAVKFALSFVITACIVYTFHKGGLKLVPEGGDFQRVQPLAVVAYVMSLAVLTWFRSVRWRFLLRSLADIPRKRLLAVSCVGFAAILLLPFRIGEFVRPYLIRTPAGERESEGRSITLTAATSTIVAERVIDGFYLSLVLAFALFFVPTVHPLPDKVIGLAIPVARVRAGGYAMLGIFTAALITIAVFYFARAWAHRTTLAVVGKVSLPLAEKLAALCEKLADGLHVFGRGRDALGFLVESTFYWTANALGMWLLAWGCGVVHADGSPPTFGESCAEMGLLGCTLLIPGPPGLLGVFQVGVYAGMTMFYPTSIVTGPGAAYVFLLYACQFGFQVVTAGIGLASMGRGASLRALEDAEAVAPDAA
jgi:hypothetical protein